MENEIPRQPDRANAHPSRARSATDPAPGPRARRIDCTEADPAMERARRPARGDGARREDRASPGRRGGAA